MTQKATQFSTDSDLPAFSARRRGVIATVVAMAVLFVASAMMLAASNRRYADELDRYRNARLDLEQAATRSAKRFGLKDGETLSLPYDDQRVIRVSRQQNRYEVEIKTP